MNLPKFALGNSAGEQSLVWIAHLHQPVYIAQVGLGESEIKLDVFAIGQIDPWDDQDRLHFIEAADYFFDRTDDRPCMNRSAMVRVLKGKPPKFVYVMHEEFLGVMHCPTPRFIVDWHAEKVFSVEQGEPVEWQVPVQHPSAMLVLEAMDWFRDLVR